MTMSASSARRGRFTYKESCANGTGDGDQLNVPGDQVTFSLLKVERVNGFALSNPVIVSVDSVNIFWRCGFL